MVHVTVIVGCIEHYHWATSRCKLIARGAIVEYVDIGASAHLDEGRHVLDTVLTVNTFQ
jgi:hypothetical protein